MPVINDMFPGTTKYREPLEEAYNTLLSLKPVASKKSIRYKILHNDKGSETYMGAEDSCFEATWEVCLGKEISREKGVDLNDAEILANCLVNLCFLGRYPKSFEAAHRQLLKNG